MIRPLGRRRSSSAPAIPYQIPDSRGSTGSIASTRELHTLLPLSPLARHSDSLPTIASPAEVARRALLHASHIAKGKPDTPALSDPLEAARHAQRYLSQLQDDADLTLDVAQTWRRIALAMATALYEVSMAGPTSDFGSTSRTDPQLNDGFDADTTSHSHGRQGSDASRPSATFSSSQSQFLRPCVMPDPFAPGNPGRQQPARTLGLSVRGDGARRESNMRLASGVMGLSTGEYIAFRGSPTALLGKADVGEEADDGTFTVNQHVILLRLGRGTQGEVYLAMDTVANELRAIKAMRRPKLPRHAFGGGALAVKQAQREQLEREVSVMKQCRHPSIVSLYEVIDDPEVDTMYLVLQYVEKGPIATLSPQGTIETRIDPGKLAQYTVQLCSGLQYLHKKGVIHRDIKPDNILIGNHDDVYLADFGMADLFDGASSRQEVQGHRGTFAFMAPELLDATHSGPIRGEPVDVWALGVTLYVLLFGTLPWSLEGRFEMQADILTCNLHEPLITATCGDPAPIIVVEDSDDGGGDAAATTEDLAADVPDTLEAAVTAAPSFIENVAAQQAPRPETPDAATESFTDDPRRCAMGRRLPSASSDDSSSDSEMPLRVAAGPPSRQPPSGTTNFCVPTPPRHGSSQSPHAAPRRDRHTLASQGTMIFPDGLGTNRIAASKPPRGPSSTQQDEPQNVMSAWMTLLRRVLVKPPGERPGPSEIAAMARHIIDVAAAAEHPPEAESWGAPVPAIVRRRGALFDAA